MVTFMHTLWFCTILHCKSNHTTATLFITYIFYRHTQPAYSRANRGGLCNLSSIFPVKFTLSGSLVVVEEIKLGLLVK